MRKINRLLTDCVGRRKVKMIRSQLCVSIFSFLNYVYDSKLNTLSVI